MASSELYSDETCSSADSGHEYIDDYELEVEQFDVGSTSPSNEASEKAWEDNTVAAAAAFFLTVMNPLLTQNGLKGMEQKRRRTNFMLRPFNSV